MSHAEALVADVLRMGAELAQEFANETRWQLC
jgi:hypothetical protein